VGIKYHPEGSTGFWTLPEWSVATPGQ